ncbi:MAG: cache domain-containing protein [Lachnospiraceae bacterium]|nr:cache domain-containing protein [Lachnospiraceae bacterium]
MKLRFKIAMYVLVPLVVVAIFVATIGRVQTVDISAGTVEQGLKATAVSIQDTLHLLDEGAPFEVKDGELWKGQINVTQHTDIVDDIMTESSVAVTIFYGDTRYSTSLMDENGNRMIGTQAKPEIVEAVITNGGEYIDEELEIAGVEYYGYYRPLWNDEHTEIVGMVFTGMDKEHADNGARIIITNMLVLIGGISLIAFIISFISISKMTRDLGLSVRALDSLANGNLNAEVDRRALKRRDEIGKLMRAVLNLRGQMKEVIGAIIEKGDAVQLAAQQVNEQTDEAAKAIGQVDMAVSEISEGATSQATETQSATENVIIMGEMVEQTREEVETLLAHAEEMQAAGDVATQALDELDEINGQTKKAIDVIYEQTHTTNESAMRIREVTKMITGIAEETNLLSLNASIEAARAGEQGRGFAVVAAQIQKLAEQSNASTKEIAQIINVLMEDSEKAVTTMNEVKAIMDAQNEKVVRAGEAFSQVKAGIDASIKGVEAIEEKTIKLDDARANVIDIVQNLTAIAEENAAATQETSASVTEVTAIVEDIAQNAQKMNTYATDLKDKTNVFYM